MSDTFCILPFTHLSTRPNGDITPCCRSRDTLGNIKEMTEKHGIVKNSKNYVDNY